MISFSGMDANCFFNGVYSDICLLADIGTKTSTIVFTVNYNSLELLSNKDIIAEVIFISNDGHKGYLYAELQLNEYFIEANIDNLNTEVRAYFNSDIKILEGFGKELTEATAARVAVLKSKNNL